MASIPGVIDAESGYANGINPEDANYQTICSRDTGFRETVRVEYDPGQVSLDALLMAYFYVIDQGVFICSNVLLESHSVHKFGAVAMFV